MRLELYHVGQRVFATTTDVLPILGSSIIFPMATAMSGLAPGDLATAIVDVAQPPLEFDFSDVDEVVLRLAIRRMVRLDPD